jgi:hypothetical protein
MESIEDSKLTEKEKWDKYIRPRLFPIVESPLRKTNVDDELELYYQLVRKGDNKDLLDRLLSNFRLGELLLLFKLFSDKLELSHELLDEHLIILMDYYIKH